MCTSRALSRICDVSYFKLQLISQVNIFEENFKGALAPKWIRNSLRTQPTTYIHTAKWIWDRSIYSIIKPSFCSSISVVKLFRNNNKNNFVSKCCKFLANLCKSSEILEQCHVKWWLKYRNNRSVSWRLSCTNFNQKHLAIVIIS